MKHLSTGKLAALVAVIHSIIVAPSVYMTVIAAVGLISDVVQEYMSSRKELLSSQTKMDALSKKMAEFEEQQAAKLASIEAKMAGFGITRRNV
jgi:uncharacterized membrane protein (DUF106 family)